MPIKIFTNDHEQREIAWLCDDNWRLPDQIEFLEQWLHKNASVLPGTECIVDVGFCARNDARGGGTAMSPQYLGELAKNNIRLFLSEYDAVVVPTAGD